MLSNLENADNVTHNGSERMNRLDKPRGRKQNPLRDRLDSYPRSSGQSINLVSFFHINYFNLGEVVQPHYIHLYSVFSRSSIGTSACGLLTGRRDKEGRS
ncbi:hypothetical protein ACS0TY_016663 [Phlomoides rotata]